RAATGERVVAGPARPGHGEAPNIAYGERVVAAESVGVHRLAGADVEREGHEVGAVEPDTRLGGLDGEHGARGRGAVDLHGVVAGVAGHPVRAVAVVPHQRVVAGAAAHQIDALGADQAVVAVAAAQRVVGIGAGEDVVATFAVERG